MRTRIVSLLLALALLLALGGVFAEEVEEFTSGDYVYTLDENGEATIVRYTGSADSLALPAELDGHSVTAVGVEAFYSNETLVSVTVPEGIRTIGGFAFAYCSCLTSVSLPNGLIAIGNEAFLNSALESLTIPETVTTLGKWVVDGCYGLTSLRIPNSVVNYESSPVANPFMRVEIIVDPDHPVFEVVDGVLFDKTQKRLVAYRVGDLESESYAIPEGTETIGESAFEYSALQHVSIPDSVKTIERWAFRYSESLQSLALPEGVVSIGDGAFAHCDSLASVNIPDSVTELGYNIFDRSTAVLELHVSPDQPIITLVDGVMFSKDLKKLIWYPSTRSAETYAVPEGTEVIGGHAFAFSAFSTITIPSSVTCIEKSAFSFSKNLKEITIPASVTVLENDTFVQCHALEQASLPEGLTSIGSYAFQLCDALKTVNIPSTVTQIGRFAFRGCAVLENLEIPAGVEVIEKGVFNECPNLTLTVAAGSPAEQYCIEKELRYTAK